MTPGQVIALVRDGIILAALGFILWFTYRAGQNQVKVADLKALELQLQTNAALESEWQRERQQADDERDVEMGKLTQAIGAQRTPVVLCHNPGSGTVSGHPPAPSDHPAGTGGVTEGSGKDIRPLINAFETKFETALANCRAILKQWPTENR